MAAGTGRHAMRAAVASVAFALAVIFVPLQHAPHSPDELDRSSVAAYAAAEARPVPAVSVAPPDTVASTVESAVRPTPQGVAAASTLAPSPPRAVSLPSIGVQSDLEHLPLLPDGTIAAPLDFAHAGWFAAGPQPGQPGPAVIAGHVDSYEGPAIFYRLRDLQPGDPIQVQREDGAVVSFRVTKVEEHPKDQFPSEAVYGPVAGAELRLITCGGEFDRRSGHYLSNVVVFAVLA